MIDNIDGHDHLGDRHREPDGVRSQEDWEQIDQDAADHKPSCHGNDKSGPGLEQSLEIVSGVDVQGQDQKYQCADWSALDDNAFGVPVSGILRAYNSLLIQPNPTFGAELNYYKSFRSGYDRAFETGDYAAQTEKIGGAFDVNEALREAIDFETKNSFQSYVED